MNAAVANARAPNQFALSTYWFAIELHWAALLGAAMQAQIARFIAPGSIGTATAILGGIGALLSVLSQLAAGRASDRMRRRIPFLIAGTIADIVALFAFAIAPSFVAVVVSFAAVELAFNIGAGPYQALIPDFIPKNRQGRASGIMGLYRLAGTAGGLLLARILVKQPGPNVPAHTIESSLIVFVAVLSCVLLVALAITLAGVRDSRANPEPAAPLFAPWASRGSFIALIISRSFLSGALYLILPFLAFYLRFALHVRAYLPTSLDLLLLMVACSLVGTVVAGALGDRMSKKTIMFWSFAVLAVGALTLSVLREMGPVWAIGLALGAAWGAYYSVDWALACNLLPAGRAGGLMAVWNIGASGPQVAALVIGGLLIDRVGALSGDLGSGYRALFVLITALVGAGAFALAFVREPRGGMGKDTN